MKSLQNQEELEAFIEDSKESPVILFKHSVTCPISAGAHERLVEASTDPSFPEIYKLVVQESREMSQEVAEEFGVIHESPQTILFKDGQPIFDTSHHNITKEAIKKALL